MNCPNIINICIFLILTSENLWSVLIIENEKNILDFLKGDWIAGAYIDFLLKSLTHQLIRFLEGSGINQGLSYEDICRVAYNTNPSVSSIWLVENLRIFTSQSDFSVIVSNNAKLKKATNL